MLDGTASLLMYNAVAIESLLYGDDFTVRCIELLDGLMVGCCCCCSLFVVLI